MANVSSSHNLSKQFSLFANHRQTYSLPGCYKIRTSTTQVRIYSYVVYNMADDPPPSFFCPISHQRMIDPVVTVDGHSYERKNLVDWFDGVSEFNEDNANCMNPPTLAGKRAEPLTDPTTTNNLVLKQAMDEWEVQVNELEELTDVQEATIALQYEKILDLENADLKHQLEKISESNAKRVKMYSDESDERCTSYRHIMAGNVDVFRRIRKLQEEEIIMTRKHKKEHLWLILRMRGSDRKSASEIREAFAKKIDENPSKRVVVELAEEIMYNDSSVSLEEALAAAEAAAAKKDSDTQRCGVSESEWLFPTRIHLDLPLTNPGSKLSFRAEEIMYNDSSVSLEEALAAAGAELGMTDVLGMEKAAMLEIKNLIGCKPVAILTAFLDTAAKKDSDTVAILTAFLDTAAKKDSDTQRCGESESEWLPTPWKAFPHAGTGTTYYANPETKLSFWTIPEVWEWHRANVN